MEHNVHSGSFLMGRSPADLSYLRQVNKIGGYGRVQRMFPDFEGLNEIG